MELRKVRLGEIATIVNGATPSTTDPCNYDGDIVWITPKDLSDQKSKYIKEGSRNITQKGFDSCSAQLIPPLNILMSSRAPIGLLAINEVECCTNQGFKNIIVDKSICDADYMFYYLHYHMAEVQALGSGTTFKEVSKSSLERLSVTLPNLSVQRKIGKLLSDIDRKIALNRWMNATLEAMARQLYDYWFLQFDFPDAHGKPYKSSGGKMTWNNKLKRDIPEGWEVIPLEKLCRINNETITKDTTLKIIDYLDTSSITRNNITNVERLLLCEAPSRAQRKVADLTILYSTVRPRLEHHGILCNPSKNMIVSTGFTTIDANKRELAPYIYSFLKSPKIVEYLANLAETAVSSYPSITPKDIASLNVLVPANAIIERFSEIIEESYRITASNQKMIFTLTRLRSTLLPLLMNGQVSVS